MTIFLLSLGGLPPTAGFIGKWYIFSAAVQEGHYWLAIIGVLTSVISVFFYLRIVVMMYMTEGPDAPRPRVGAARSRRARAGDDRGPLPGRAPDPGPRSGARLDLDDFLGVPRQWLDAITGSRLRNQRTPTIFVSTSSRGSRAESPSRRTSRRFNCHPQPDAFWISDAALAGRSPFSGASPAHVTGFDLPPMIERCRTLAAEPADALVRRLDDPSHASAST